MSSIEVQPMTMQETGALLNTLLEAERAGAAVLTVFMREPGLDAHGRAEMRRIQRDESHNCGVLMRLLGSLGIERSARTGDFVAKALDAMRSSHVANIAACEALAAQLQAKGGSDGS